MKKLLFAGIILCALNQSCAAQVATVNNVSDETIIAWWAFNEKPRYCAITPGRGSSKRCHDHNCHLITLEFPIFDPNAEKKDDLIVYEDTAETNTDDIVVQYLGKGKYIITYISTT